MNKNNTHFVGYFHLSELIKSHDTTTPLYLCGTSSNRFQVGSAGIREWRLTVADIQNGICRYWMMKTCAAQTFDDKVMPGKEEVDFWVLHESAVESVRTYCQTTFQQLTRPAPLDIHKALVAVPDDYRLLEGCQDFIRYDRQANRYELHQELAETA